MFISCFALQRSQYISDRLIKVNPLKAGLYQYGYFFNVKLDIDNKYEFSFKVWEDSLKCGSSEPYYYLIISTGTWDRQGNILTLWDTNLQHKFYGLIRKDGSIELLFFRWVEDMVFKKR